jgi:endonuclease-3
LAKSLKSKTPNTKKTEIPRAKSKETPAARGIGVKKLKKNPKFSKGIDNSRRKFKFSTPVARQEILRLLDHYYKDARCALDHDSAFQLLIATILSAQCTDERVNQVTPNLFAKYPDPSAMANADVTEIERLIHSTGFYRNKAKNIKNCATEIVNKYGGEVPQTMEQLSSLAGVGRKTANVVLGNVFGVPGLVVDTHVTRLSNRLGLANGENAVKLEADLQKIVPKENWTMFAHWLITHGRAICKARSPNCSICFLETLCPKNGDGPQIV